MKKLRLIMSKVKLFFITVFLYLFYFRKNIKYIVCPDHIGETVYALLFYEKLKQQNPQKEMVVVCFNYIEKMCEAFNVDGIIPNKRLMRLFRYYCAKKNIKDNKYVFYAGYCDGDEWWTWKTNSVFEGYAKKVMKSDVSSVSYPKPLSPNERNVLKEKYAIHDNSVLIAPYAKTVDGIGVEFWKSIADKLTVMGYKVYTNVAGKEQPIQNTVAFNASLSELFYVMPEFKCFIGLRSGLCDLVALSSTPMIVVTNDSWKAWEFDYFALAKSTVINYNQGYEKTVIENIIKNATQ